LPILFVAIFVLALVGGIVWKTWVMQQCFDDGEVVIDSFGRHQRCVNSVGPAARNES